MFTKFSNCPLQSDTSLPNIGFYYQTMKTVYRSSESVTEGHPDAICNKIAGAILDAATRASLPFGIDPRVAIEVSAKGDMNSSRGTLFIFGEVSLPKGVQLDFAKIARKTIRDIGYTNADDGFYDGLTNLILAITQQSSEISHGVTRKQIGAGDQGLMFGGAVANEGPEYMPLPIMVAHAITAKLTKLYKQRTLPQLRPDAKSQVVIKYEDDKPVAVEHITVSVAHNKKITQLQLKNDILTQVIKPILAAFKLKLPKRTHIAINAAGPWTIFGPLADAGTTNRKIIVDSYGGAFPHGGGGFNGKDWTKVDMSGAVAARFLAKNLVARNLAKKIQVEVCYTIGLPKPQTFNIETFDTETVPLSQLYKEAHKIIDLSVSGIIKSLHLAQPIYERAASGGWFGRNEFPWEKVI